MNTCPSSLLSLEPIEVEAKQTKLKILLLFLINLIGENTGSDL